MTSLNIIKTMMQSILVGSFIYTIYISFGAVGSFGEVVGVWIASAAIGAASTLHFLDISKVIAITLQTVTGLVAFTTVAIVNGWIELTFNEIFWYMVGILMIMTIIIGIFAAVNILDARKINDRLKYTNRNNG